MKIKILTFHSELNFGANLQAYALKEFLNSKGHNVSFINFNRHKNNNKVISFIRNWVGKTPSSTYLKIKNNIVAYLFCPIHHLSFQIRDIQLAI